MAEDNPEGHEGSGGLDQEGGAQQTVPLPLPAVRHAHHYPTSYWGNIFKTISLNSI